MDKINEKHNLFERNILALARPGISADTTLCSRLSGAETTLNRYKFLDSPSGEIIPAWVDQSGLAHPLHSMVDPMREARRLMETLKDDGFVILLGLGGGFYAEAALEQKNTSLVLVIDYDINSIAELLCYRDYIKIFNDPRFHFLADPPPHLIEEYITGIYQPILCGGIRTLPLRGRTSGDNQTFTNARLAIENAIHRVSADYSVQAYFGLRWFGNIIRNIKQAAKNDSPLPPIRKVAVTAAGPSLDSQIKIIREKRNTFFLIAADTSLPSLLSQGITPDSVVAIDCQHISYYHFMSGLPKETILFMDLAGPPLAASLTDKIRFFSGNHPLTSYICREWRALPEVDTSGGNVTYASIALAERLGAESIELYGADFSYPMGLSYARGAYIHPFFEKKQMRLAPLESQHSAFLYRGPLNKKTSETGWYYESPSLTFYRERLEEKCKTMTSKLLPQRGSGAPIQIPSGVNKPKPERILSLFNSGKCLMEADEFLLSYKEDIASLSVSAIHSIKGKEKQVFTTLLPAAAAIKHRNPGLSVNELLEKTKAHCIGEIEKVLG